MEKIQIKLNGLSPIIISLIEKIQLLESALLTKQQKLDVTKELCIVVDNFRKFFREVMYNKLDEHSKIFNERLEKAFSQFEWNSNVAVSPFEFKRFSENAKILISSILKLLGVKKCGILVVETYVKFCIKIVVEMIDNLSTIGSLILKTDFKLILDAFSLTANMFKKYWHISFLPNQKNAIILCLYRLCKGLQMLLKLIEVENTEIKEYVLNIVKNCLNQLLGEIHSEGNLQSRNYGEEFIALMNFCLFKLNEISNSTSDFPNFIKKSDEILSILKPVIDELLCCVISIAHVTNFENDYAAVLATSKKVLLDFDILKLEVTKANECAIKLYASGLGETLCDLECQVNATALRLVLEVFSGVNSPLKCIINKCRANIAKHNKMSEDLNVLISDFDLEMDRIMQIGFFIISCTSSLNRILKIQSCLANLEILETELIASLTSLYMDCSSKNKTSFQYLIDFWLNDITELKLLIDSILDPASFCGVVCNQISSLILKLKNDLCINRAKCTLQHIIKYSKKLIKTLKISMEDDYEVFKATEKFLKNFSMAVQECEVVLNLIDKKNSFENLDRIVKRCDLLMFTLNKLSSHLFDLVATEKTNCDTSENSEGILTKSKIPQKNYYKLYDYPETLSSSSNLEILTPYIDKGLKRSKIRNFSQKKKSESESYLIENFDKTILQNQRWDVTPISLKRSRCCKPLNTYLELENTIDLEITTILENISHLNDNFSKTVVASYKTPEGEKKGKDVACGVEENANHFKPLLTSSGCCTKLDLSETDKFKEETENSEDETNFLGNKFRSRILQSLNDLSKNSSLSLTTGSDIDTPDRLNDLERIKQKIDFLKLQAPDLFS